jgi:hypothetical protein
MADIDDKLISDLVKTIDASYTQNEKLLDMLDRKYQMEAGKENVSERYLAFLSGKFDEITSEMEESKKYTRDFYEKMKKGIGVSSLSEKQLIEINKDRVNISQLYEEIKENRKHINELNKAGNKTEADEFRKKNAQLWQENNKILNKYGKGTYTREYLSGLTKKSGEAEQQEILEHQNKELEKRKLTLKEILEADQKNTEELRKQNEELKKQQEHRQDIVNGIKAAGNAMWTVVKDVATLWTKFNAQAISDAKQLGLTSIESARAYTQVLMENSKELSRNFGMSAEQAMKMQEAYTKVTGRATILTKSQMEDIAASSRLMGEETVTNALGMMDNMGTTSQTAMELLDKNYARAVNSGVNTVKASEDFVKNLSLANKLTFKNGVDGISKMTILSQRIKMNLQEVANVADKFSTIEGAIEGSAQLQMLGGSYAMFGGNPMQMMYEATSDPEALFERMGKMFSEQAVFDRTKGEAVISTIQMRLMREAAKAMGANPEEMIQSAKKQASLKDLEAQWRRGNPSAYASLSEEERNAVTNKAQFVDGKWQISYLDETGEQQTKAVNTLTSADMKDIMKENIDPLQDIRGNVKKIASSLVSLQDRYTGAVDAYNTNGAQQINGIMEGADDVVTAASKQNWLFNGWGGFLGGLAGVGAFAGGKYAINKGINRLTGSIVEGGNFGNTSTVGGVSPGNTKMPSTNGLNTSPIVGGGKRPGWRRAIKNPKAYARLMKMKGVGGGALVGAAGGVLAGALEVYNGVQEANATHQSNLARIGNAEAAGRISGQEAQQRTKMSENQKHTASAGAWGAGIGTAIGAGIGSLIPIPVVGSLVGGYIGGAIGKWMGNEIGEATEDHSQDDEITKELTAINKGNEKDNIRKIVLPVESIDYNVALIARCLGYSSASPARGNVYGDLDPAGGLGASPEVGTIEPSYVAATQNGGGTNGGVYQATGVVTLEVKGTIKLDANGTGVGNLTANDIKKLIDNNPSLQEHLKNIITKRQSQAVNAGRELAENSIYYRGGSSGTNYNS